MYCNNGDIFFCWNDIFNIIQLLTGDEGNI